MSYAQVDNCMRDNKNGFFLGRIEYLVARGVFQPAEVRSLPVGHTYEEKDQVFISTTERNRIHDAITLDDFHE